MKTFGGVQFGTTPEECREWRPTIITRALALRVLCVAKTRVEGTWRAYVDAVPGMDHRNEYHEVLAQGEKLDADVAAVIFPEFRDVPYAR